MNPFITHILGEQSYKNLLEIPADIHIDVLDIFRKSEDVFPHVQEAIQRGDAKTILIQEGIMNNEAEAYARSHGLNLVVSNFCLMEAHKTKGSE